MIVSVDSRSLVRCYSFTRADKWQRVNRDLSPLLHEFDGAYFNQRRYHDLARHQKPLDGAKQRFTRNADAMNDLGSTYNGQVAQRNIIFPVAGMNLDVEQLHFLPHLPFCLRYKSGPR